eukprot:6436293-Prymnesium_polylepis.1
MNVLSNGARPTSIATGTSVEWTVGGSHDYKPLLDLAHAGALRARRPLAHCGRGEWAVLRVA